MTVVIGVIVVVGVTVVMGMSVVVGVSHFALEQVDSVLALVNVVKEQV